MNWSGQSGGRCSTRDWSRDRRRGNIAGDTRDKTGDAEAMWSCYLKPHRSAPGVWRPSILPRNTSSECASASVPVRTGLIMLHSCAESHLPPGIVSAVSHAYKSSESVTPFWNSIIDTFLMDRRLDENHEVVKFRNKLTWLHTNNWHFYWTFCFSQCLLH